MKHIKKVITWYLFAISWVCFFLFIFKYLPENKLFDLSRCERDGPQRLGQYTHDHYLYGRIIIERNFYIVHVDDNGKMQKLNENAEQWDFSPTVFSIEPTPLPI